jgi:uncharacterized protein (DUF4415 family)
MTNAQAAVVDRIKASSKRNAGKSKLRLNAERKAAATPAAKAKGPANGNLGRTPRMRYIEPRTKSDGNPFHAMRVNAELLSAAKKYATKKGTTLNAMLRSYMARLTGVSAAASSDDDGEE